MQNKDIRQRFEAFSACKPGCGLMQNKDIRQPVPFGPVGTESCGLMQNKDIRQQSFGYIPRYSVVV